jgi:hypothetical protein
MMSIVGLNASNLVTKREIHHTQTFWKLTHLSLLMRLTPWRQTAGSTPQSPSLDYFIVQSIKRLYTQHNNSKAQLEPGGLPTVLPYLLITTSHGVSSIMLSMLITFLWVYSTAR